MAETSKRLEDNESSVKRCLTAFTTYSEDARKMKEKVDDINQKQEGNDAKLRLLERQEANNATDIGLLKRFVDKHDKQLKNSPQSAISEPAQQHQSPSYLALEEAIKTLQDQISSMSDYQSDIRDYMKNSFENVGFHVQRLDKDIGYNNVTIDNTVIRVKSIEKEFKGLQYDVHKIKDLSVTYP